VNLAGHFQHRLVLGGFRGLRGGLALAGLDWLGLAWGGPGTPAFQFGGLFDAARQSGSTEPGGRNVTGQATCPEVGPFQVQAQRRDATLDAREKLHR
jgi:hypothetical protein